MKFKRSIILVSIILTLVIVGFFASKKINLNLIYDVGQKIDTLQGVYVYYNGGVGNIEGREVTKDGYNLGLRYQCVEFVKRYYYEALLHKMPDSYGHAKDFLTLP